MNTRLILVSAAAVICGLASCKQKDEPKSGSVREKIDDALDRRPNEKIKDAVEDLSKDAKKAGEGISEAVDKAAQDAKKKIEESK